MSLVHTGPRPVDEQAAGRSRQRRWARQLALWADLRSPHRLASWGLAAFTFLALSVAAVAWSLALAGRWTLLGVTAVVTTFATLLANGYFRVNMAEEGAFKVRLAGAASALGVTAALVVVSAPGLGQPRVSSFVALMLVLTATGTIARSLGRWLLAGLWSRGHLRARALVFGYDELAREMAVEISLRRSYGVDIVGYVIPSPTPAMPLPEGPAVHAVVDLWQALPDVVTEALTAAGADRLLIGPAASADERLAQKVARWAAQQGMAVHAVPRFHGMGMGLDSTSPDRARGYALVRLQRSAHPHLSIRLKRLMDVAVSGTFLLLASPLMTVAALAVRLSGPGPILFAQERVGQHGRPIVVRKFRSMTMSAKSDTEWNAEARVTRIGRLLRRTNIDELPQLISVLVGDMSLVGPRPERPAFVEHFRQQIPDYDDRHRLPVGLTGLAQVAGLRGDTSIAERVKYDNLYIDQWRLRADVEILLRTVTAILFQERGSRRAIELESAIQEMRTSGTNAVEA
ncbi:MAG: sugar transferase [Acidimicrobiales bacterium]